MLTINWKSVRHQLRKLTTIGVFPVLLGAAACDVNEDARVTIVYEQIANFSTYSFGNSTTGASPNIYVMYRVASIANNGIESEPFTFDRSEISTVTSTDTVQGGPFPSEQNNLLLGQSLVTESVPAGTVLNPVGGLGCFIVFANSNDPSDLNNTSSLVDLLYASTLDQPVTVLRAANDTTTAIFPDGPATPGTLQGLCGASAGTP